MTRTFLMTCKLNTNGIKNCVTSNYVPQLPVSFFLAYQTCENSPSHPVLLTRRSLQWSEDLLRHLHNRRDQGLSGQHRPERLLANIPPLQRLLRPAPHHQEEVPASGPPLTAGQKLPQQFVRRVLGEAQMRAEPLSADTLQSGYRRQQSEADRPALAVSGE